jgi:hypothetical protein
MALQTTVYAAQGFGVVGEVYDDSPLRAQPFTLVSALASYNVFGRGFSVTSQGVANAGNTAGTQKFAGILINPKAHALFGDGTGPLNPALVLPNQAVADLCTMGQVVVALPGVAAIGDLVCYNNTTGVLTTIAPSANLAVGTSFAFATVTRFTPAAVNGIYLAVIELSPTLIIPVLA